jgi:hypothetical protein
VSRLRADFLVAASVPLLLAAGLLPWQRDEMCTVAGCGVVQVTAWGGSPGWTLPVAAGVAVGGLWVLLLPSRPAPTWLAALTAAVGGLGALVLVATLDAVVFGRAGFFRFELPVVDDFPVLSVRPGIGLPLGLLGLVAQAVAGWMTVRARGALVTPWRPPPTRRAPDTVLGLAQGPPAPRRGDPRQVGGHGRPDAGAVPGLAGPGSRHRRARPPATGRSRHRH